MRGGGGGTVDMSWYFFVVVGHGRVTLVDVGTDALSRPGRNELRRRWAIARATDVSSALSRTGLSPDDVTDVVLTHHHWDHVGALGRFDSATVHAHPREWRRVPARLRSSVEDSARLSTFAETGAELWPGFTVREAGRHTEHQVMVELACERGPVVIASDAAYLHRNVEERKPVAVTVDRRGNVADVRAAAERVGPANVLPGHDPALFERHPSPVRGVAAICE
jgi:glyoxylase-like metal-dependent hydrolase (beta-lactamase superfamily II)